MSDLFEASKDELIRTKFLFLTAKDVLAIINKHIPVGLIGKRKNKARVIGCYLYLMKNHTFEVYTQKDLCNQWGMKHYQQVYYFMKRHNQLFENSDGYRSVVLLCLRDMKRKNERLKKVFENKIISNSQ